MTQKFWCLGDDFTIRDYGGRDRFLVDGRALSFGDKLSFQDMSGTELAFIRQKHFSWGPTYVIERPGQGEVVVRKEHFTFFRCKFEIDGPGDHDFEAEGDFLDHEYRIEGSRGAVANVSKRWFSLTDSYGIEIAEKEDIVLLLATAVVIDLICHNEEDH